MPIPDAAPSPADPPGTRPWTLLAAGTLVGLEAIVLIALGSYVGVRGFLGEASSVRDAELVAAMALLAGGALLFVARGLMRARRWARTPAVLTQVFALVVAWEPLQDAPEWRYPTLAVAVTAGVLLAIRRTGDALRE